LGKNTRDRPNLKNLPCLGLQIGEQYADLRRQAETCLPERQAGRVPPRNDADTQRLLHELEVHQIELEMQNAELQRARVDVDAALEKSPISMISPPWAT